MIGLLLLFFIGKAFFKLAEQYKKNKWLFAILGIVSYYLGVFLGGIIIALGYELYETDSIDNLNDTVLGLMALPFGVLICWGFYKLLVKQWEGVSLNTDDTILDEEFMD